MAARKRSNTRRAPTKRSKVARRSSRSTGRKKSTSRKWSAGVMQRSDALDLEGGVFKKRSARQVALSLKKSAAASRRRKSNPFRSAMSMLNFEINRAGRGLSPERRRVLNHAKSELRKAFHRPPA